jgi:hypothetical protein
MKDEIATYLSQLAWMDTIGCFLLLLAFSRENQKIVGLGSCYSYARPLDNLLLLRFIVMLQRG